MPIIGAPYTIDPTTESKKVKRFQNLFAARVTVPYHALTPTHFFLRPKPTHRETLEDCQKKLTSCNTIDKLLIELFGLKRFLKDQKSLEATRLINTFIVEILFGLNQSFKDFEAKPYNEQIVNVQLYYTKAQTQRDIAAARLCIARAQLRL